MKSIHRCVYMKTNVVYGRNRYFYALIWNIAGSSTRDRNCLCLSAISIARGRSTGLPYQRMIVVYGDGQSQVCGDATRSNVTGSDVTASGPDRK
jgi:hypothetical protein